jgi:hypothetical protein
MRDGARICTCWASTLQALPSSMLTAMWNLKPYQQTLHAPLRWHAGVRPAPVAHACNPSYLGGWDQEDRSLSSAWVNRFGDPISKITWAKWTGGVTQEMECLLSKCKAVCSNPSFTSKKKKVAGVWHILYKRRKNCRAWRESTVVDLMLYTAIFTNTWFSSITYVSTGNFRFIKLCSSSKRWHHYTMASNCLLLFLGNITTPDSSYLKSLPFWYWGLNSGPHTC